VSAAGPGALVGRSALITGAARGQGEAEARTFVAEGASVVLADVLDDEGRALADELGPAARYVHCDVTCEQGWASAVELTVTAFGGLDILVNNAGVLRVCPIENEEVAAVESVFRVNLLGPLLGIRASVSAMRSRGGGSIVNISSLAGMQGLNGYGAYSASKWGLRGLTKSAALEFAADRIRVNSVHPGAIDTRMINPNPQPGETLSAAVPLQRAGTSDEVAQLVLFLASEASSYITGGEFVIDGGALAGRSEPARAAALS
jgi:3alpha(or 20beta)-hydroxysteroid dehydrogenase